VLGFAFDERVDFRMLFNRGFKDMSIDGPVSHLQI
jgi:hypothetical protein